MQIKLLEQQIAKQKRTKKSIQARQRQARKNGNELNPNDVAELERVTTEQSGLQKQLEALRKQQRQHQMMVQDYRNKQKEQFGRNWLPSPVPAQANQAAQVSPVSTPSATLSSSPASTPAGTPPQTPPVRVPGANSVRLTRTDRQEYEAYMQNRLRMLSQQTGGSGMPMTGPRLPVPSSQMQGQVPQGQLPQGQIPPGQLPQGQHPPGQLPPGQHPPGQLPPGQLPPGQLPPGQLPPGQLPPGQLPPGQLPPGQLTPGQVPPVQLPPGQVPPVQLPPGQISPGQISPGQHPSGQGAPGAAQSPATVGPGGPMGPGQMTAAQQARLTTVLGDNNPFSEGFQQREQLERFREKNWAQIHEGATPPTTEVQGPAPADSLAPPAQPLPQALPQMQFFRERGMTFEQGPRFTRAPGLFAGEGAPRPFEGPRPPAYPGPPGLYPQMPGSDQSRLPFPQGLPFQPGQNPPSTPAAPVAVTTTTATTTTATTLPPPAPPAKMTEFPIKPQSETERRILEILSKTAALAQKEGDEQLPGGKSARGKTAASSAAAPPSLQPPPPLAQQGAVSPAPSGTGIQPQGTVPAQQAGAQSTGPPPLLSQGAQAGQATQLLLRSTPPVSDQVKVTESGNIKVESPASTTGAPSDQEVEKPAQDGSSSIPHLETQVTQSSVAMQSAPSYESPPHLQPQTDVSSELSTTSKTTPSPQTAESASAPPDQPPAHHLEEQPSGKDSASTDKPADDAYDEPDGGASVTEGGESSEPKKKFVCDDGIHCGTDDEEEEEKGPDPPKEKFVCDDGIHCGTDDEDETPAEGEARTSKAAGESSSAAPGPSQTKPQSTEETQKSDRSPQDQPATQSSTEPVQAETPKQISDTKDGNSDNPEALQPTAPSTSSQQQPTESVPNQSATASPAVPVSGSNEEPTSTSGSLQTHLASSVQTSAASSHNETAPSTQSTQSSISTPQQAPVSAQSTMHPSPPQSMMGQGHPRPPFPQGHSMLRHLRPEINPQVLQEQMMRAGHIPLDQPQAGVGDTSPQAPGPTQRLPPSYATAIMSGHAMRPSLTATSPAGPTHDLSCHQVLYNRKGLEIQISPLCSLMFHSQVEL
ncbi:mucin-5AC-like isoform X5 [Haliotis rubra]|uniref:mucin-5AC-like isoform X5 n=1 Tax=Haliotis rubra TaxID=36100 RepID=UPI001EE5A2C4|nr:mucin-5AC-like isoform X5 [Haliotis rubra]